MGNPKIGLSKNGEKMHYSVGAIIERNCRYLLVDRAKTPLGFASIAGHIDENENKEDALVREVKEEGDLKVESYELISEEELDWNKCRRDTNVHYWYIFNCETSGEPKLNPLEAKSIGWYPPNQIRELTLEPVWEYWFKKLKVI